MKEALGLNKQRLVLLALLTVSVVSFGALSARLWLLKPADAVTVTPLPATEYDPAVWGQYYPLQYQSYQKNSETAASPTGYNGSINYEKAERQSELYTNFAGNPFSKDYTEDRGHLYALEDLSRSKRIGPTSKGACITCKTPQVEAFYQESGWGYAAKPLSELLGRTKHPVTCANCHDPATMNLRVLNPAFIEALERRGIDIKKASRNEMRSYVCGQCHAEYYFAPGTTQVVFPWDKGLTPQEMYEYYSAAPQGFTGDWVHPDSQAAILKAQHPDFEEWQNGTHGKFGVSCADCHMPYLRSGGKKYSSHWMTSPLRTVEQSCRPCHEQGSEQLYQQVKATQDNTWMLQRRAGLLVARAHAAIKKAATVPTVNPTELAQARELVRKAQWHWDYVAAANSQGFHNAVQELHTLGQAIDYANQAVEAANRAAGTNQL